MKRETGDITARLGQTRDQPTTDRIDPNRKNNWNRRSRLAHGRHGAAHGYNNIDLRADEFGSDFRIALGAALRPTIFDGNGAVLDPAEFAQARYKRFVQGLKAVGSAPRNPMVGSFPVCCELAASGQNVIAPAMVLTKSRRLIAAPASQDHADNTADYSRDLEAAERLVSHR